MVAKNRSKTRLYITINRSEKKIINNATVSNSEEILSHRGK